MRVGVYVDGFNLEFGARAVCGPDASGWRWLDIRRLSGCLAAARWTEMRPRIQRVVYCTARLSGPAARDQDVYLRALRRAGSVDHIELGQFVTRVMTSPLAGWTDRGRPRIVTSRWPLQVQDRAGADVPDAAFIISHLHREEKGSDVNVATHLLVDALQGSVDAAVVITNDGDLALPLRVARASVPVGTVNPGRKRLAGKLKGVPDDGVGGHWWTRLDASEYRAAQLPSVVGCLRRPSSW